MLRTRLISTCARCFGTMSLLGLLAHVATAAGSYTENPGTEGEGKYTIGPEYKIDPDLTDRGNPKGKSFEFTMPLADSKIFRGDDSTLEPEKKPDRKSTRLNSSHSQISYAVFCLKKKKKKQSTQEVKLNRMQ